MNSQLFIINEGYYDIHFYTKRTIIPESLGSSLSLL